MKNLICHIVDRSKGNHIGIDQYIAEKTGWSPETPTLGMTPERVASFRGLYDQNALNINGQPLISDNVTSPTKEQLDEAFDNLMNFKKAMGIKHAHTVVSNKKHLDRAWDTLRHAFSYHERRQRIGFLSALFSQEVDRLMGNTRRVDRQAIINGFRTTTGEVYGGPVAIFESMYNFLMGKRQDWFEAYKEPQEHWNNIQKDIVSGRLSKSVLNFEGAPTTAVEYEQMCKSRYEEVTKLLECWDEIVPFVMRDLVDKEGVKLGIKKDFMVATSTDAYTANNIAAKWDMSEAVRDGWQRNNDLESAFGTVGQQVRRILSTIYEVETIPDYEVINGRRVYRGMKTRPVLDGMGYHIFKNPVQVHQYLSEYLRGVQDSKDVVNRLMKADGTAKISWMQPLVDIITSNNDKAVTQLFVDFKKNFQPYSEVWEDKDKSFGVFRYLKTFILNKPKNLLKSRYILSMSPNGVLPPNVKVWGYTPIFEAGNKGNKVNWRRLGELRAKVLEWTHEESKKGDDFLGGSKVYGVSTAKLVSRDTPYNDKREFLMEVFTSLGFDTNCDTIDAILHTPDIYRVKDQLEQLFDPDGLSGFLYTLPDGNKRKCIYKVLSNPNSTLEEKNDAVKQLESMYESRTYKNWYNLGTQNKDGSTSYIIKEHTEKLLDIINKYQDGMNVESRARYMDNTMYSFVNPSYLGDRLEAIQSFVNKDDHDGLLNFISEEYLKSPFFVDNDYIASSGQEGRILNMWLSDLVDACKDKKTHLVDSVAAIFNYERDLGNESKKFEDFTIKEHGVDMLIHFFADEKQQKGYGGKGTKNVNKKQTALYPVFILGDAGVSKYIRAPRISTPTMVDASGKVITDLKDYNKTKRIEYRFDEAAKQKILDRFYDLYQQEKRRMKLDEAMTFDLYANGKKVEHPKGEFSFLTFLNPSSDEYSSEYRIPENLQDDRKTVTEVIRKYLENSTLHTIKSDTGKRLPSFKQRLTDMGVLETAKNGKGKESFKLLNAVMSPENVDQKLSEFYWNTVLATAEQLQLMTIDPSFYHNTKDLQKRYKEIHAPGTKVDIYAKDANGNLYSKDGMEHCVYFKDLRINSEELNTDFMEFILKTFVKPEKLAEAEAAIKEGILVPIKGDDAKETARVNKLIDLMGNDTYKKVYKPYTENTLTDGQGYRTLKSYRKVMGMAGKWTESMEEVYNTIAEIGKRHSDGSQITANELNYIRNFALTLQPIKPYMFTHEQVPVDIQKTDKDGKGLVDAEGKPILTRVTRYIPVQHKYAEALIIPELLPVGSKLRDLGEWMDDENIDMAGSDKIAKVGCFGQADLSQVKNKDDLRAAMKTAYRHKLSYNDYRIQTNVPEHINASQLFGTQVRKLIMAGLNMENDYSAYLDGQKINLSTDGKTNLSCGLQGNNLLALYNSLICANIMESYEKFENNAGDIEKVAEMLQQSTIGSTRESMDNLFSYVLQGNDLKNADFLIPLFEGGLEHDTASMLLSVFKKIVNKQQISGGSAVQVSAFGIDGYEEGGNLRFVTDEGNNNVLYAEIEMPFDKTYNITVTDKDGNKSKQTVDLSYDKYCFIDGNLKPTGNALEKGSKEWKKYQSYTYKEVDGQLVPCSYKDAEAKVYKPLIEEEYPDILSILAYRIPSESDYSMLNCRIKRFTSKMAGGTLKVPAEGTTIAGFDFDIDKLYFMQREFHKTLNDSSYVESKFSDTDKRNIWSDIYDQYPELKEALTQARANAEKADAEAGYPKKLVEVRTLKSGRVVNISKTRLNDYYDQVNGEKITGKTKRDIFREKAQEKGYKPDRNLIEGEKTETLDTYDFTKAPEDNSRATRNNLLISLIQARLMDKETIKQRYTPGGFEDAKHAARLMRELQFGNIDDIVKANGMVDLASLKAREGVTADPEPNYSAIDPYTMLVYNQQNQVAGKLIGIFANQNTHNAFVSCMEKFELKKNMAINFCGHHNMRDLLHKDPVEAARVNLNVAQFLAASVDAVKDPVLNFMNLNTVTADPAALLARLGYNMDEIAMFFNQPVIVDICQEVFNSGKNIRTVISDMEAKLEDKIPGKVNNDLEISMNDLALGIVNNRRINEKGLPHSTFYSQNAEMQYAVLEMFSKIIKASQDVSDFVLNTKFTASNAVSSTFGGLYAQQLRVNKYLDKFDKGTSKKDNISYDIVVSSTAKNTGLMSKPIDNDEKLINMSKKDYLHYVRFNPFAYEQAMYDTNRKALQVLKKYFPYETSLYQGIRNKMQSIAMYGTLSEDEINEIHSAIPVALLARQLSSDFHGEGLHQVKGADGKYRKTKITNREYYREHFAKDLNEALASDSHLNSLDIFKYFTPDSTPVTMGFDNFNRPITKEVWTIALQDVGGFNSDTKEVIKESWAYLMEVDDEGNFKNPKYAEIGRDLFMYCFYQMGFKFSPISFMHLAPTAVKDNIKVERQDSLPLNSFEEGSVDWDNPNSNDVLVWQASTPGSMQRTGTNFDVDHSLIGELQGNLFRIDDSFSHYSVLDLVNAAISHPELTFNIDKDLTAEEFKLFSYESLGKDVPANICFSKGTLENQDNRAIIPSISYGKNRTYRQFLKDILDNDKGKTQKLTLDEDDFIRQWILNHLDNSKFVLDTNRTKEATKEILTNQIQQSLAIDKNTITLDISAFLANKKVDSKAIDSIVKLEVTDQGNITNASWVPVICYNGSFYMAESNSGLGFNINKDFMMTYKKVEPLGSTKTLEYDNGKKMTSSMRYQAFYGEGDEVWDDTNDTIPSVDDSVDGSQDGSQDIQQGSTSQVSLENRDPSDVQGAFNAIKEQAEKNGVDVSKMSEAFDKLINEDLRSQVANSDDSLNDDVYDFVDETMEDTLGRRGWRNIDSKMKEDLVSTVFDFNKNPKYLETKSPVGAEDPIEGGSSEYELPDTVRSMLEKEIAKKFIEVNKEAMQPEDYEGLYRELGKASDTDLAQTASVELGSVVAELLKAYRKDGVDMLDADGNPTKGC